ncbi:MAG: hypothetical protein KW793_01575 [Candidatus Doudnabacteria bacterium]|nr:hypothetical protein [Candidatus Doudnabacteria bacterium]
MRIIPFSIVARKRGFLPVLRIKDVGLHLSAEELLDMAMAREANRITVIDLPNNRILAYFYRPHCNRRFNVILDSTVANREILKEASNKDVCHRKNLAEMQTSHWVN